MFAPFLDSAPPASQFRPIDHAAPGVPGTKNCVYAAEQSCELEREFQHFREREARGVGTTAPAGQ